MNTGCSSSTRIEFTVSPSRTKFYSCDCRYIYDPTARGKPIGNTVAIIETEGSGSALLPIKTRITSAIFRRFLGPSGKRTENSYEFIYVDAAESNTVRRISLPDGNPLPAFIFNAPDANQVENMAVSFDGRYVAIAGKPDSGSFQCIEVWNFDMPEPFCVVNFHSVARGPVTSMCFGNSNLSLYVSMASGEILVLKLREKKIIHLERGDKSWLCRSITCCPENAFTVFAGDGPFLWFFNSPNKAGVGSNLNRAPFRMAAGKTISGAKYLYLPEMPDANLSCLNTRKATNQQVNHVRFLNGEELLVVGDGSIQILSFSQDGIRVEETCPSPKGYEVINISNNNNKAVLTIMQSEKTD